MCIFNNELWVGGTFEYEKGIFAHYLAKWDGNEWCVMETWFNNRLLDLTVYNNDLYVLGGFHIIDTVDNCFVAK
ncbi:MAG: hypothetical protein Kow0068_01890 [Marinilabiliales bacterium]